jgi:hypothetical protein
MFEEALAEMEIFRECEEASAHERAEDVNQKDLALIHLNLGNKDRTLEWLEKAFKARSVTITPFLVKLSPFFDDFRSEVRRADEENTCSLPN